MHFKLVQVKLYISINLLLVYALILPQNFVKALLSWLFLHLSLFERNMDEIGWLIKKLKCNNLRTIVIGVISQWFLSQVLGFVL